MNRMEMKFSARSENEMFARMSVISFISMLNPNIDEVNEIKTIISEAVTNSIIHGYDCDETKEVHLKVLIDDSRITITIEDFGIGIKDIDQAKLPLYTSRPEIERSGMGLTIIEAFSDDLVIESKKNIGTKLTITKEIKTLKILSYV